MEAECTTLMKSLVVTTKIANNIIHKMLVDNGSAANILYQNAYQKTGIAKPI